MIITHPSPNPQRCTKTFMDLPHELLDDIFGYLSWEEVLSSSVRICKRVHAIIEKDYFWQKRINAAIQLPLNLQDVPQIKGIPRKRIFIALTKALFCTWGESTLGKLGHSYPITGSAVRNHRVPRGVGIPLEIRTLRNVFIVDIKTGGWSTHFLTFSGDVYSFGSMNGQSSSSSKDPVQMRFPDPIVQISAGRDHLVALSSKGEIWSYIDLKSIPQRIMFSEHVVAPANPNSKTPKYRQVRKVIGGWTCSGALLHGVGIIIWNHGWRADPMLLNTNFGAVKISEYDNWVRESHIKPPGTDLQDESGDQLREAACQIVDFVILEGYVVLLTESGKVYCVELRHSLPSSNPILLEHFSTPEQNREKPINRVEAEQKKINRISGSYKRFAVYNKHGLVHMGDTAVLRNAVEDTRRTSTPDRNREQLKPLSMPSLKRFGTIVQIVFGDYHTQALTSDGRLLSWGFESQSCGCFGIGDYIEAEKRGVVWQMGNGCLQEAAEVFFHDPPYPKRAYPKRTAAGVDWDLEQSPTYSGASGDSIDVRLDDREFCVLSVTAAGWHSGALVLPITDSLRNGTKRKERSHEVFPPIQNDPPTQNDLRRFGGIDGFQMRDGSEHAPRAFNPDNLRMPRTGHGGIVGISTIATGMRGGLRVRGGRLHGSGVVRSGAVDGMKVDEETRRRFGALVLEGDDRQYEETGESSHDARGSGGRQLGEESVEAGEQLAESIRTAVRRGGRKGPVL